MSFPTSKKLSFIFLLFVITACLSASQKGENSSIHVRLHSKTSILHFIEKDLKREYMLLSSHQHQDWDFSVLDSMAKYYIDEVGAEEDFDRIILKRDEAKKKGIRYTNAIIRIDTTQTYIEDQENLIYVQIEVLFEIPTTHLYTSKASLTTGKYHYEYSLTTQNNAFFIVDKAFQNTSPIRTDLFWIKVVLLSVVIFLIGVSIAWFVLHRKNKRMGL